MLKKIVFFSLFLFYSLSEASSWEEIFVSANKDYQAGNYKEAIEKYRQILQAGIESSNVYYNLGNAYFKNGERGRAIVCYYRALKKSPRDKATKSNLQFLLSLNKDKIPAPTFPWLFRQLYAIYQWFTLDDLTLISSGFYFLLAVFLTIFIFKRERWIKIFTFIWLGLFLFSLLFLSVKFYQEKFIQQAVIIAEEAEVRYGPDEDETLAFSLHEGTVVEVLNQQGAYCQIKLKSGEGGWIRLECLEFF